MDEIIHHLAIFVSRLWQMHIFFEGNTRTTAVFFIKYLRNLGFTATNDIFANNAWYFRNTLVRANYTNLQKNIHEITEYLEMFLKNLLLNEQNELHNRDLHINANFKEKKVDINDKKVDIENKKVDFEKKFLNKTTHFNTKTIEHIYKMFDKFGYTTYFGRSDVVILLGLHQSSVTVLFNKLLRANIIEPVRGHGKGKYQFIKK